MIKSPLSTPFFYFLVSHPTQSFLLNFLSAFTFSSVLLFFLNLPSIHLFFSSRPQLPNGEKFQKVAHSGSGFWVQAYGNGDAYNGKYDGLMGRATGVEFTMRRCFLSYRFHRLTWHLSVSRGALVPIISSSTLFGAPALPSGPQSVPLRTLDLLNLTLDL
ncbi:hypothetical protein LguiB_007590 [Lonicera macranthoides]